MDRTIKVGETDSILSRVYFDIRLLDNVTPALGEAGFQPQTSLNGAGPSNSGISVLTAVGFGKYTAQILPSILLIPGDVITTRYARVGVTAESRGDNFLVIDNAFTQANALPVSFNYYGSLNEADLYFSTQLRANAWTRASPANKINALRMATEAIDRLNFAGDKADSAQRLQFPRRNDFIVTTISANETVDVNTVVSSVDVQIPDDIKVATYKCAYRFLDGWDADMELENSTSVGLKFGPATSNYNPALTKEWIRAGIPSGSAWLILRSYLRDPNEINLSRGN